MGPHHQKASIFLQHFGPFKISRLIFVYIQLLFLSSQLAKKQKLKM